MSGKRRRFNGSFKAEVALEAIRGERTINEIASERKVHPNQVTAWKRQALELLPGVFSSGSGPGRCEGDERLISSLYEQIGRLKMDLEWLKKKVPL